MLVIWTLRLFFLALFLGGIAYAIWGMARKYSYNSPHRDTPLNLKLPLTMGLLGLAGLFWAAAATYVPATHKAVVENTATGSIKVIGPGIHIWPFQPNLVPLTSKVTDYNMRNQRIEIGTEKGSPGIAAGSNSPGNPVVYIKARGWAAPDPSARSLVELHRRYGPGFLDDWVERNLVETTKAVQGQHGYDFLIGSRNNFAAEVEEGVQASLRVGDRRLAIVSQLAITDFDYPPNINEQLDQVAQKEFERQKADKDADIALKTQAAENIKADTQVQLATKEAQATIEKAKGEAQAIREKYGDAVMSDAYLRNQWIQKWNGELPGFLSDDTGNVLVQIPQDATR